jgi:ATP-dependent RNA helicase TDRD12
MPSKTKKNDHKTATKFKPCTTLRNNLSDRNIFINGLNIRPVTTLAESSIHEKLKDYFHINGYNTINEFESYLWPAILRGRHVLAVSPSDIDSELNFATRKRKNKLVTFISPVLTLVIKLIEREKQLLKEELEQESTTTSSVPEKYVYKRINGPRFLIICSSCKNAQKIFELMTSILINDKNLLKIILLQGGAKDESYDVKLTNGCDVLICATPYCLLRMLGNGKTNLERLEFFIIDEANIVLEKYPKQMRALMDTYANLLKFDRRQKVAQFILFSSTWSTKLRDFVSSYFMDETISFESKLEASYFGNVNHIVHEIKNKGNDKLDKLIGLIETNTDKNVIIFINDNSFASLLYKFLKKRGYLAQIIDDQTNHFTVNAITNEWLELAEVNKQLILICSQTMLTFLTIRNATCIIHFEFPQNKTVLADRLWVMSDNFHMNKNGSNLLLNKKDETDEVCKREWVELESYFFLTQYDEEFSEGFFKFLKRIGVDE